jgi:hypothetical protein
VGRAGRSADVVGAGVGGSIDVAAGAVTEVGVEVDGVVRPVFARFAAAGRYEVRPNPCSTFEVRHVDTDETGAARTLVFVGDRQAQTFGFGPDAPVVVNVPVSANCAGAPVSLTAGGPRSFVLREKRDVKLDFETYQAARKETKVNVG